MVQNERELPTSSFHRELLGLPAFCYLKKICRGEIEGQDVRNLDGVVLLGVIIPIKLSPGSPSFRGVLSGQLVVSPMGTLDSSNQTLAKDT